MKKNKWFFSLGICADDLWLSMHSVGCSLSLSLSLTFSVTLSISEFASREWSVVFAFTRWCVVFFSIWSLQWRTGSGRMGELVCVCVPRKHADVFSIGISCERSIRMHTTMRTWRMHECFATRQADATGFKREKKLCRYFVSPIAIYGLWRLKMWTTYRYLGRRCAEVLRYRIAMPLSLFAFCILRDQGVGDSVTTQPRRRSLNGATNLTFFDLLFQFVLCVGSSDKMWHNIWRSAVPTICIHIQQYNTI